MRFIALALALAAWAGCNGDDSADGTRGPCAAGGQILGCEETIETAEDACWKLVDCGVFPIDDADSDRDWAGCVDRIELGHDDLATEAVIACVAHASCDELIVDDSPSNPYEWPGCLEYR